MGPDCFRLIRRILLESFHCIELVDQHLYLIHPEYRHKLRVSSHHEVASSPLHQCINAVTLLGGDVKTSICDSQPWESGKGILNRFLTNVHHQGKAIMEYFFSDNFRQSFPPNWYLLLLLQATIAWYKFIGVRGILVIYYWKLKE